MPEICDRRKKALPVERLPVQGMGKIRETPSRSCALKFACSEQRDLEEAPLSDRFAVRESIGHASS
jgi:hypothetical protein